MFVVALSIACTPKASVDTPAAKPLRLAAPDAPARDHIHDEHGVVRPDPYHWMRDRDDPELVAYLEAENAYTAQETSDLDPLRRQLYDELLGRIQETDLSVPVQRGAWWTYTRTEEGLAYPIHCRVASDEMPVLAPGVPIVGEEVLLDLNVLAEGHGYLAVTGLTLSEDDTHLAYAVDTTGEEIYEIVVRDLSTGEDLPTTIPGTTGDLVWANDGTTLFYSVMDDALRPHQVMRHAVSGQGPDEIVFVEDDDRFRVWLGRSRSDRFLFLGTASPLTSEVRVLDADDPEGAWQILSPRHLGHEYSVAHQGDRFLFVSNDCDDDDGVHVDCAMNFKLMQAPLDATDRHAWTQVEPHRDDATLLSVDAFADHLVITERAGGVRQLRIVDVASGTSSPIEMPEAAYWTGLSENPAYDTPRIRYVYTSPITPRSVFAYDPVTGDQQLLKQQEVPDYDPSQYRVIREWATAPDGAQVPLTVVMRTDLGPGPHATYLTGYGAYGISYDPWFSTSQLSLLDRGLVVAIAHVRGGGAMGRAWYEDGKFLNKRNTFDDFIASAEHLINEGLTAPNALAVAGGSAGGMLMGAVANLRPDLFTVVVADVPFVDVVTTILDESISLTANEWEEWGDPRELEYFEYMLSYSPYDNVAAQSYPAMLITSGLNDTRVPYWEPTKWAARLRDLDTGTAPLLLKTNMGAGHGGNSGRYGHLEDIAFRYAFVLGALEVQHD